MKAVVVTWQDPDSRLWIPVGRLSRDKTCYTFVYARGAEESKNFVPFPRMKDLKRRYVSEDLFPIFANRVMPASRPEYQEYIHWLGVANGDPLHLLARSEGIKVTDGLQLYPVPDRQATYEMSFFCHGIRHLPKEAQSRVDVLQPGERLFPMLDLQNPFDAKAVALRTNDPIVLVGYCPSFLAQDIKVLLQDSTAQIIVEQRNDNAPIQLRLLCKFSAVWPEAFMPFDDPRFLPLA